MSTMTTDQAAVSLACSVWHVRKLARNLSVGYNVGGKSGWRFTPAEVEQMRDSMRPAPAPARRRRRRTANP